MNVPLLLAGILSFVAAAIHGIVGDALVVRRLDVERLPRTRFGGPTASMVMIRVSWHLVTTTFVVLGIALMVGALADDSDARRAVGILAASAFSAFGLVAMAIAIAGSTRGGFLRLLRHPAPALFTAIAGLAWWGAL